MTASAKGTIGFQLSEIGAENWDVLHKFDITATPARKYHNYMIQAVADTEEAISVGDVGTIELMIVHCITNDVEIDPCYATAFEANVEVQEGEWAMFKPSGTVYMKNNGAGESVTMEYWLIGT